VSHWGDHNIITQNYDNANTDGSPASLKNAQDTATKKSLNINNHVAAVPAPTAGAAAAAAAANSAAKSKGSQRGQPATCYKKPLLHNNDDGVGKNETNSTADVMEDPRMLLEQKKELLKA